MFRKKRIALNEKLRGVLTPDQEKLFIYGCIFYEEYTNNGKTAISKEQAEKLGDSMIALINSCIAQSNLDLEYDKVASGTLNTLWDEMERRNPTPKEDIDESLQRFIEKNGDLFK